MRPNKKLLTHGFIVVGKMFIGVSVGEQEELRVAVEGDVGEELLAERLDVLGHGLGLDLGERSRSGEGLLAWVGTCATNCTNNQRMF